MFIFSFVCLFVFSSVIVVVYISSIYSMIFVYLTNCVNNEFVIYYVRWLNHQDVLFVIQFEDDGNTSLSVSSIFSSRLFQTASVWEELISIDQHSWAGFHWPGAVRASLATEFHLGICFASIPSVLIFRHFKSFICNFWENHEISNKCSENSVCLLIGQFLYL